MKRLDQGHLHPKLEVPGLTCAGRESNPGASTQEKSHSNSLFIAFGTSTYEPATIEWFLLPTIQKKRVKRYKS
jgi:hypothetical protein